MSVIIRLQNLPWSANSLDIRHYFRGLSIPEGGVHIVGGEMGDAFIAFSTDEDARQAMMLGGGKIKEVQISLMLSSRSEMQKIIEAARQASMSSSLAQLLAPPAVSLGAAAAAVAAIPQSQQIMGKEMRDGKPEKKDSGDLFHESGGSRRDRRDKSRSRSRERNRKDRRDSHRDRDRDRRRRSRSRSRSRDRRRKRSRSRSRGRDSHNRDRERKDLKDERKDKEMMVGAPSVEPGTNIPNLDILNPNTWNVMQKGTLAQNAHLLTNFELLRNLASQKGPLIPGGPNSILPNPLNPQDNADVKPGFPNNEDTSMNSDFSNRGNDFGSRNKGDNARGGSQRGFENFEDNNSYGGDGRFERNRGSKFQNFDSGFPMRNGSEPLNNRFGNFGRPDNGFPSRGGPGSSRDRPGSPRGLLDFPVSLPQREHRGQSRQDRFSSRDDKVDEFGRSIQLRNRKNASNEETFKDEGKFQGNQASFSGFPNRFGGSQTNQRPPPLLRGRDSWPPGGRGGDGFPERRGFRGSFDEPGRGGFRSKGREPFGKFHDDLDHPSKYHDKDCCVEIRNLNPKVAYWEVRRPFSSLKLIVKEVKFFDYGSKDKKCRIRFLNNENKRKAMQMSNKILVDNKQVHLLHINDSDFDECVDEGVKKPEVRFSDDEDDATISPKDAYIQVKDLSLNVEEGDIAKLFPNAKLDKILLEKSSDGKSKSAYLKFQKAIDAKVALGTPNRSIGDSVVFLTPLPHYVFNDHLNKSQKSAEEPEIIEVDTSKPEEPPPKEDKTSACILMKNLPLEANDRDICDFFSDVGLVPNKIHLMLDMAGQPSGDAFCEFSDSRQIERACSKNSAPLGKNSVSVCQVPRSEMLEALGVVQGGLNCSEGEPSKPSHSDGFDRPHCVVSVENIPFRANAQDIINFFGWNFKLTENDVMRRYNDRGQPTGDAKVCFKTPEDALIAVKFNDYRNLKGRIIRVKLL